MIRLKVAPGEMERIIIPSADLKTIQKEITVSLEELT